MTAMLASVRTLDEALFALEAGADFIDLKEPSQGALGALDHAAVRVCVQAIGGRRPVSATIGDIVSMDPREMTAAVERMAATGVDYIKIGLFVHPRVFDCVKALTVLADRAQLVAVIFADEPWSMDPSPSGRGAGVRDDLIALTNALADAGFAGAMLDTAHKTGKTLRDWRKDGELRDFVKTSGSLGLLTGLAGSLRKVDVPPLLKIEPDYLGFRGALCSGSNRNQNLDSGAFAKIRSAIPELESIGLPL
ncbi:MAG TPA: (5-formylfuran-3-yl)methyl phosphate synthase [Burkholderiales bacterium]|jgi:dihydroneopterin aldolase|nr:(5-formylfuran-3-yl)methyl phosphate synthase [Burkholderiales bacterium]